MTEYTKLGNVCSIKSAKRIFESEYVNDGIPFIRGQEISDGSINKSNTRYECRISFERYDELKQIYGVPQYGDILITAVGTIGNLYYVDTDRPFYYKDGNIIQFTDFSSNICSKYLFYFMKSPFFKKQLEYSLIGAVQKALTMVMLSEIRIPLPPVEQQIKIANMLSTIDDTLSNNYVITDELEAMAKTLYDYWFVQFDFPDENGKPYRTSGGEMVWNEQLKREIPKGWDIASINQMTQSYRGVSYDKKDLLPTPENGVLVLRGNNIQNNRLVYDNNVAYIPYSFVAKEQQIHAHDIILTMSSGSKEHIGKCTIFQYDSPHTYGAFLTKFTPDSNKVSFVYLSMISDFFKKKIKAICNGTGINNLTNETFDNLVFPKPNEPVLNCFEEITAPLLEKMGACERENEELTKLRDWLLPMLMNGQARVE